MSVVLVRIDNRLLHGVVASQWVPISAANRVMVIDDHIANDPILKSGMQMGKPPGTALSIINEETAYNNFSMNKYAGQRVFIIVSNPEIVLKLIALGVNIPELNIGGTATPDEGIENTRVSNRAYIRKDQEEIYRKIMDSKTPVIVQYLPKDQAEPLSKFIK